MMVHTMLINNVSIVPSTRVDTKSMSIWQRYVHYSGINNVQMIILMSMTTPLTVICRLSSTFIVDQGHEPSWDRMLTEIRTVSIMVMSLLSVTMTNENSYSW